ncbi:MAG: GPW/gp25 family protein [Paludibacteraceae bacterium]|nr:GPW/gp25 family protein [Paludibacteraceae bacterium]
MADDKSFLGNGWAFPPEFIRATGETKIVSEEEDIKESLYILLSTSPGERVMYPEYGCGLKSLVFSAISESLITILKDMVSKSILFFEPRITVNSIEVNTTQVNEGILQINILYAIRMTNTRSNLVYPYYFIEGTNVKQ